MTDMIDSAIEKLLDKRKMDWGVRHQEGDPFYFIKGHERVELQSGGDLLWLYKADGMVEEFNDRMIEEAVQRLIEEHVLGRSVRGEPKIDFLWTTASGAWLIKNTTRKEAYEKVIKNRMDVAFPGMSEEDKRAEAEGWFVENDQLIEIAQINKYLSLLSVCHRALSGGAVGESLFIQRFIHSVGNLFFFFKHTTFRIGNPLCQVCCIVGLPQKILAGHDVILPEFK